MGDISYQTAAICSPEVLRDPLEAAVSTWHDAAPAVQMRVVPENADCEAQATIGEVFDDHGHQMGGVAEPGSIEVQPGLHGRPLQLVLVHELGHLLIGDRYGGSDPTHNPSTQSVMYWNSDTLEITEQDVALLPKWSEL